MNLKILVLILFFFIFIIPIFADWYEQPEVRILDKHGRVVPNASVYIVWEISRSAGNATTKTQITNDRGRAYFQLYNREFNPADENRKYTVYVQYLNKNYSEEFIAGSGSMPRTINIDAYLTSFRITDKEGNPLSLKLLIDSSYEIFSDSNGRADIILNSGEHTVKPIFFDLEQIEKFKVEKDTKIDLQVNLYSLLLRVVDDNGVVIPGVKVNIGPFSFKTNSEGLVTFSNLTKPKISAEITYQKYSLNEVFNISSNSNLTYVLDTHPPKISDITTKVNNGLLQIRAVIADVGRYPSGFTSNKAKINLRYSPSEDVEKTLPMYSVGYNTYETIIKLEPGQKSVKYTIEASDSFGNTAFSSDIFLLEGSNQKNQPNENSSPPIGFFDLSKADLSIFIYPFVLGIIAGIGFYLFKHKFSISKQEKATKADYSYSEKEKIRAKEEKKEQKPPSNIFKSIPKKTS
ncbi:MAG: hypothetical protein ACK4J0_02090 [Candidatus Anstonellaceae archaeon]